MAATLYVFLLIYAVLSWTTGAWAGPVNTPESVPFALANARGDVLSFGNLKGLLQHRWKGEEQRTAALRWTRPVYAQEQWSGGLAEPDRWQAQLPAAIACSGREAQLFFPELTAARPAGRWDIVSTKVEGLQCAMQEAGHWLILDSAAGNVTIDGQTKLKLPSFVPDSRLLAAGSHFLLLSPKGEAWQLSLFSQGWQWSAMSPHPLGEFSSQTSLRAQEALVLRADGEEVRLARVSKLQWTESLRLPVQPCEEGRICGASLARDESWLVSGYWGHYLGVGTSFRRLSIPLSATRESSVAIAHQGLGGRFLYLGSDDGDTGTLPSQIAAKLAERSQVSRWFVWEAAETVRPYLKDHFQVPIYQRKRSGIRSEEAPLLLRLWEGALPESIPSSWKAWEPSILMGAPEPFPRAQANADVFAQAWWREGLGLSKAQAIAQANGVRPREIHVSVVDSGSDLRHPWLQAQLFAIPGEIPNNSLDDDANGFVDDVYGYDFVEEDALPQDEFGHGTHVAGLLSASQPDLPGVAPQLRLSVLRALDRSGKSNSIDLARALHYAVTIGSELINCSWGGGADTQALRDVFTWINEQGVQVISSAGNDGLDTDKAKPEVPKRYPGVVAIGAVDKAGKPARYSNYGRTTVNFFTPGDAIVSSLPGGLWGEKSGTSMASPLATASVAWLWGLLKTKEPDLSSAQGLKKVWETLCATSVKEGVQGRSVCGRIRLDKATEELLKD